MSSSLVDTVAGEERQNETERSSAGSSILRNSSNLLNDQTEATTQWFEESASFQSYVSMERYEMQTSVALVRTLSEILRERDQSDETESFSGTIWSSVPSSSTANVEIRPPMIVPCHDNWALSPHPNLALRSLIFRLIIKKIATDAMNSRSNSCNNGRVIDIGEGR